MGDGFKVHALYVQNEDRVLGSLSPVVEPTVLPAPHGYLLVWLIPDKIWQKGTFVPPYLA